MRNKLAIASILLACAVPACAKAKDVAVEKGKEAVDKVEAFVAERAAIGKWTCEPSADDWRYPSKIVVVVESDQTFTVLEDTRPNNAVDTSSSFATGSWKIVDGNLKVESGGEQGRFESVANAKLGKNSIEGFWGIENNIDVDIKSADEFTIRRTPTEMSPRTDNRPWTCTKA